MQFSLLDRLAMERGMWSISEDGSTQLIFYDMERKARGQWDVHPDGSTGLQIYDTEDQIIFEAPPP